MGVMWSTATVGKLPSCLSVFILPMYLCRLIAASFLVLYLPVGASEYVGSDSCRGCHEAAYTAWESSHHFQAMRPADDTSVLARFDGEKRVFHGASWIPERRGRDYLVNGMPVRYTFGFSPLQQYLVEQEGGRLQALNLAWDSRPEEQGGQNWFHLREAMTEDSPFSWSRHLQNWNGRCAECHSTHVKKKFDRKAWQYSTSFSEANVGCEACHGPAGEHLAAANAGEFKPLFSAPATVNWKFTEAPIAVGEGRASDAHLDMCGGCHSRRSVIGEISPGSDYFDQYDLALLGNGLYHADGQIRDEVFVLGSFLQSKMHVAGVTCMNCHEAHSGRVRFDDNRLCAQCHNPASYDVPTHTLHETGTAGSYCVDCHMPTTTYMRLDDRRDHRFGIPDPALTVSHGVPNACSGCHDDQSPEWAARVLGHTSSRDRYALAHTRLLSLDPLAVPRAIGYISNETHPVIKRATLLTMLPMTEDTLRVALENLESDQVLLRQAAARKLGEAPGTVRQVPLTRLANDPSRLVRREAGRSLVDLAAMVSAEDFNRLLPPLTAYRNSLLPSLDLPSTLMELARLELGVGNPEAARSALEDAIRMEPHYVPALLNLADLDRADGFPELAGKRLTKAVEVAPDSGAANHSYGLYLVRQGKTRESLHYLEQATLQFDASPRFAYVYAVALDSVSGTSEAVDVLRRASGNWPNQFDLLMLEVLYREKTGLLSGIRTPLRALAQIAPGEPQVVQRLQHYGISP